MKSVALRVLSGLSALVFIGCVVVAFVRAASSSAPRSVRRLEPAERAGIAARLASQEQYWRSRAEREFPGDRWSQDDDFHNLEHMAARREALMTGAGVGDVLLSIDEGLRARPEGRRVSPAPCKPRPFYQ
jgi:hypothetical protein